MGGNMVGVDGGHMFIIGALEWGRRNTTQGVLVLMQQPLCRDEVGIPQKLECH